MVYRLALDWTPNINHIGFFVGRDKGFFKDFGIDLIIQSPETDNYKYSPAKKIELGISDFGLVPTESLVSFRTKEKPFKLYALATIFQSDISAIAVREDSGIKRPKDLDGKSYASYGARYEEPIIRQLIKNDGGLGKIKVSYPKRLGVWDTITSKKYDSTWIFLNWEGIDNQNFTFFKLKDFNIPYSYSPLVVCSQKFINEEKLNIQNFLSAMKKGYMYSLENVEESTDILFKNLPENDKNIDLYSSLIFSKNYFGDDKSFGKIKDDVILKFFNWLKENKVEKQSLNHEDFYLKFKF